MKRGKGRYLALVAGALGSVVLGAAPAHAGDECKLWASYDGAKYAQECMNAGGAPNFCQVLGQIDTGFAYERCTYVLEQG